MLLTCSIYAPYETSASLTKFNQPLAALTKINCLVSSFAELHALLTHKHHTCNTFINVQSQLNNSIVQFQIPVGVCQYINVSVQFYQYISANCSVVIYVLATRSGPKQNREHVLPVWSSFGVPKLHWRPTPIICGCFQSFVSITNRCSLSSKIIQEMLPSCLLRLLFRITVSRKSEVVISSDILFDVD